MNRFLKSLIVILCLFIIGFTGSELFNCFRESKQNSEEYSEVMHQVFKESASTEQSEGTDDNQQEQDYFDYDALLETNGDCIGWIRIDDTVINYPIVQTVNNSFYLRRMVNKKQANCGSIFMDYRNDIDLDSENLIIYGHNMKDGSMFNNLNKYKDREYYLEHQDITLYLRDQKYSYEIVAVYQTDTETSGKYYDFVHVEDRTEQLRFMNEVMISQKLYETGLTIDEEDSLLTLSTCEYSKDEGRLIVVARRKK